MKKEMVCEECGSKKVWVDAIADWDEKEQEWVLGGTFQHEHCDDCDGSTTIKEREMSK